MAVLAYLDFDGKCEEALQFYCQTFGAEIKALMRFEQSPEPAPEGMMPPNTGHKVMHSELKIGDSVVMASDCHCSGNPKFQGISLTYSSPSTATIEKVFAGLSAGGKVEMPLSKTFWSPLFGTVTDRYGVTWMVMAEAAM